MLRNFIALSDNLRNVVCIVIILMFFVLRWQSYSTAMPKGVIAENKIMPYYH